MSKRFKTPGPGSYRTPSDFGYIDIHRRNVHEPSDYQSVVKVSQLCDDSEIRKFKPMTPYDRNGGYNSFLETQ